MKYKFIILYLALANLQIFSTVYPGELKITNSSGANIGFKIYPVGCIFNGD